MSEIRLSGSLIDNLDNLINVVRNLLNPPPPQKVNSVEIKFHKEALISRQSCPMDIKSEDIDNWVQEKQKRIVMLVKRLLNIGGKEPVEWTFNDKRKLWQLDGETMSTYVQFIYQDPHDDKSQIVGFRIGWAEGVLASTADGYASQLRDLIGLDQRR